MVERWLVIFVFGVLCISAAFSQDREEAAEIVWKSKYEIGLTPRWRYLSFKNASPIGNGDVYLVQWAPRIQVGAEVYEDSYFIVFYDVMGRRTDESNFYGKDYNGHKFGFQSAYKFTDANYSIYLFKERDKKKFLRLYPEVMVSTGLSNLSSQRYLEDLKAGSGYYGFYEFFVGINFVLNKSLNLQFFKGIGWEPHERHQTYKHYSFLKLLYKV